MRAASRLVAFLVAALAFTAPAAPADIPYLTGRVVDNAEVLSPAATERLTALLKAHESRTREQVAVLTVRSLEGSSIEEFAAAVFESWKLGAKGKDDGVLLVIVPPERKMRIEVGYGLEDRLTDVHSSRIIRNVMAPHFKAGDFDRGAEEGVAAILAHLKGEAAAADDKPDIQERALDAGISGLQIADLSITERILIGAFIFGIIGLFTIIGVLTPGVGWFLYLFLIPFWAMFPIAIVGVEGTLILLGTYLVGFPLAKLIVSRTKWYEKAARDIKTKGRAKVGGFMLGGSSSSSSSSWSSSSSSSGGFSGGGGISGGGGSSGSW